MVVAYAALVSLLQILDSVLHYSARGSRVSLSRAQLKSLHEKVSFLLDFLEKSDYEKLKSPEFESLERDIMLVASKAEDAIVSAISNQLPAKSEIVYNDDFILSPHFYFRMIHWALKELKDNLTLFLNYAMCARPIPFQSLLTVSFHLVICVLLCICNVFAIRFLAPLILAHIVIHVMHIAVVKGVSFASIYWRYVHQPQNQDLCWAINDISLIEKDIIKIKDASSSGPYHENQSQHNVDGLSGGISENVVVGLDSDLKKLYGRLTGYPSQLEIVPIVGMGGIGKTTLARQVYDVPHHFDIRAWVAVSQDCSLRRVMLDLLDSAKIDTKEILKEHDDNLDQILCEHLYRNLFSRRYLIVMDNVWDTKIWDSVKRFFPDNHNGSRVLLTTRLSLVASWATNSPPLEMGLLNDDDSWRLLREKAFRGECYPPGLEDIGKTIAQNCRGLPLAIVVVGGLLYNKARTEGQWEQVSKSLNSRLYNEQCLEILGLSYNNLPHHLKPCFLYMGAFLGAMEIPATILFNLWAAEGLLKSSESKSMEDVAEKYLKDLIQRNLILVGKQSYNGNIKTYKIHNLLRDFCLLNARKENFLDFSNRDGKFGHVGAENQRRLRNHFLGVKDPSFIRYGTKVYSLQQFCSGFRLLRVLELFVPNLGEFPDDFFRLFHLRYLGLTCKFRIPRSILRLWNLQTVVFHRKPLLIPAEIWLLPNLRHIYLMEGWLPEPPNCQLLCDTVLENLQTLVGVSDFRFTKGILKRIPNLKKLGISCKASILENWPRHQLDSIVNLHKLETLKISLKDPSCSFVPSKFAFPKKLKRLSLSGCRFPWGSMTVVGTLTNLQVLKLKNNAFVGENWEPVEGEFRQLEFLQIEDTDLVQWIADDTHFPLLQCLILRRCTKLQKIPCDIGYISTLKRIELVDCHACAEASAEEIMENYDIEIHIENHERRRWRRKTDYMNLWNFKPDQLNSEDLATGRSRTKPTKRKKNKGKRKFS